MSTYPYAFFGFYRADNRSVEKMPCQGHPGAWLYVKKGNDYCPLYRLVEFQPATSNPDMIKNRHKEE